MDAWWLLSIICHPKYALSVGISILVTMRNKRWRPSTHSTCRFSIEQSQKANTLLLHGWWAKVNKRVLRHYAHQLVSSARSWKQRFVSVMMPLCEVTVYFCHQNVKPNLDLTAFRPHSFLLVSRYTFVIKTIKPILDLEINLFNTSRSYEWFGHDSRSHCRKNRPFIWLWAHFAFFEGP